VCKPGLVSNWPDGAKGKRVSFADVGSTSGWLIPTSWFQAARCRSQAVVQLLRRRHARGERDRRRQRPGRLRNGLRPQPQRDDGGGKLEKNATEVVWTSEPLPNDAIAVPRDFDPALADRIQKLLVGITEAQAKTILPNHYTGFVAATHENYRMIEDAGVLVGRLKKK